MFVVFRQVDVERHLRQPRFTYSTCGLFSKHRERIQRSTETVDLNYIYKNELEEACFSHDAACSDSNDLAKRTGSNKIYKDRAYDIAINSKCHGYQRGFASLVYKFFDKKIGSIENLNEVPAQELHKPVIKNSKNGKPMRTLKIIIGLQILLKLDLYIILITVLYICYGSEIFFYQNEPLNDKKTKIVFHGFIEIVNESNHKSSTSWVDQGKSFYNNLILKVLDDNDILMDSNHNEDNSVSC